MTPGRLRSFLAVVDEGSARAAAGKLSVSESAVSASLAALQKEVGVNLLERDGRGLRLTTAGIVFADYARRILGLMDEGVGAARGAFAAHKGTLRIGAGPVASEYVVPGLLVDFRHRFPEVDVRCEVGVLDWAFDYLATHRIDVVIGVEPKPGNGLISRATRKRRLIVVGGPTSDMEIARSTWLMREPGSVTTETTLTILERLRINPPLLGLGTHGAVVTAAKLGIGVALVWDGSVAKELAAGELREIPTSATPLEQSWHIVTTDRPTPTTRLFLSHATSVDTAKSFAFDRLSRLGPRQDLVSAKS